MKRKVTKGRRRRALLNRPEPLRCEVCGGRTYEDCLKAHGRPWVDDRSKLRDRVSDQHITHAAERVSRASRHEPI